jgi:DNA-binding NtrC family response regulator
MNLVASASRVLVVGPDHSLRSRLVTVAARTAHVEDFPTFKSARQRLETTPYDLIVTDARLSEYNGLHLVYLAKFAHASVRAIVYDREGDLGVAADVHHAGAFFESAPRLLVTLPSYIAAIAAPLPQTDRRAPVSFDRRSLPRGGRRLWDRHLLGHASQTPY